ncbi:MAG: hypothetical protein EBQ78_01805 [Betaproteobacteria bacterium]|nr:hypothetical protein [Betaproteobacteria bacterium]
MTMLPTTLGNQELDPIFVCVYSVGTQSDLEVLARSLGFSMQNCTEYLNRTYLDLNQQTTVVFVSDTTADASILEAVTA